MLLLECTDFICGIIDSRFIVLELLTTFKRKLKREYLLAYLKTKGKTYRYQ